MAQRTSQGVMDGGSALPSGTAPGRCNPHQRAPRPALAKEDRPLRYPAQALSPADPCNKVLPPGNLEHDLASRPGESHPQALLGRVEDWRACLARCRPTSPVPSTSNAACGFPALRSPICFMSGLMGPILLGRLSACRVALDSC